MELPTLHLRACSLSVLRGLQTQTLYQQYVQTLHSLSDDIASFCSAYGALCYTVFEQKDVGQTLFDAVRFDQNPLTDAAQSGDASAQLLQAVSRDLATIDALIALDSDTLLTAAKNAFPADASFIRQLPAFSAGTPLPVKDGAALLSYYSQKGYGFFAQSSAFALSDEGALQPITHPDSIRLTDLKGYAHQKQSILRNTESFLAGMQANNILLYGDKGTGKSSSVKAVVNEFTDRGLKIIQLPLRQITYFPKLSAAIAQSPFHFIIFLDDLSFNKEDENFSVLKAFIEGGLNGTPDNLLIYATSNRRHLVREGFSDREGDEIHIRDTLETITSLSDRFGLEITFSIPAKDEYLFIVDALAAEQQLDIPEEDLHLLAERFALRKNGRSPRTARQFISDQIAQHLHP